MVLIEAHREALKERRKLPSLVGAEFGLVEEVLRVDPFAKGLTHKREQGWGRRLVLAAEVSHQRTAYRMAWEVLQAAGGDQRVLIWAYGSHEGFYARLRRRARQ